MDILAFYFSSPNDVIKGPKHLNDTLGGWPFPADLNISRKAWVL
jgi:hypothetical protein